jgi:phosphate transport system substrate-binding protein
MRISDKFRRFVLCVITLMAAFCATSSAEGLKFKGAIPIAENIMLQAAKLFESKTGIKFDNIDLNSSSNQGINAVMEGTCDIAGVAQALTPEQKILKPYYQIIAYDAIAVFVNVNNPDIDISKEKLKGIFTGKITNWKQIGGKDEKILVIIPKKSLGRALTSVFRDTILDGMEYGPAREEAVPERLVDYIETNKNAIGYDSFSYKSSAVKMIAIDNVQITPANIRSGAYVLSRPFTLVTRSLPKGNIKKFFDFILSREAQEKIISKKFIPVRY